MDLTAFQPLHFQYQPARVRGERRWFFGKLKYMSVPNLDWNVPWKSQSLGNRVFAHRYIMYHDKSVIPAGHYLAFQMDYRAYLSIFSQVSTPPPPLDE